MNKKTRKDNLEYIIKQAKLDELIEAVKEKMSSSQDDNAATDTSYGQRFVDNLIDSVKIPGLED